jgi:hypothetical protein
LTTSLRPAAVPSRRLCDRRASWRRPTVAGNGDPMDIVVAVIILALAALGFVWLRLVERA